MATTVTSPNMLLLVPIPSQQTGPEWATNIYNALFTIDQHTHANGSGVQVTPAGLNINADLTFNNSNATNLRTSRFQVQTLAPALSTDLGCLYVFGVDLYYRDVSGNAVRITQSAAVAGTPGSISNLVAPASAAYVSGSQTFVWQSAALTPANLDAASIILRNLTASSNGLTLSPPAAMASNFTLTLPSLPASQKIMTLDSSGNITAPYTVDGSTILISSNVIQAGLMQNSNIADFSITAGKIALATITTLQIAVAANILGSQLSPSAGIVGTQLSASANIAGTQLSASAAIAGTQLSSSANILGSQLSATAGIVGTQLVSGTISATQLASNSVTTVKILDANVTRPKMEAVGQQVASNSGNFNPGGTGTFTLVTNQTITITSSGRPIVIGSMGNNSGSYLGDTGSSCVFQLRRDGVSILQQTLNTTQSPSCISFLDPVAAGTYVYTLFVSVNTIPANFAASQVRIYAYEL